MSSTNQVPQDSIALAKKKEVFIKTSVSKSSVYVGEVFTVTYSMYTAVAIIDPQKESTIVFEHSYQERYPLNAIEKQERIDGMLYRVKVLQQYLVIANVSGKLEIPPLKKTIQRSVIDANDFFGQEKSVTQIVVSNPESVMVKPLPLSEGSDLFSHAVGNFRIKGAYTPSAKTPNLLEFNLTIEGTGNTKNCSFPIPKSNRLWEIYNVKTTNHDTLESTGLKTSVLYSFQVATNYKGTHAIPDFGFTVFNPNTNAYQKFTAGSYEWKVTQGILASPEATAQSDMITAQENGEPNSGNLYSYSILFYALLGLGFLLLCYVYFESYILEQRKFFQQYLIHRKALKVALSACKQQLKFADSLSKDAFLKNMNVILLEYIHQKKGGDFVGVLVRSNFKKHTAYWSIEIQNELELWWQHTEQNRFGIAKPICEPKELLRALEILLRRLDRYE
ncbi:BatD family protein [Flavobacterium sp.]|uniref:BatD family protein n=1 Tax=Flavobacterium sp. TaxID=239 RepID=UPI00286A19DF|nr:BatD family protein [Flavobacterium sp.]